MWRDAGGLRKNGTLVALAGGTGRNGWTGRPWRFRNIIFPGVDPVMGVLYDSYIDQMIETLGRQEQGK